MSVLRNKRSLSRLEFYHNARKLREGITNVLLRDFGIKNIRKEITTDENEQVVIQEGFPEWLIVSFRTSIMGILKNLMLNITAGNTIYPTTLDEVAMRRRYQTGAIINCEQLLQEMIYCSDVLPVKMTKLLPFVESINFEIKLLKGWRKSTNDLAKRIKNEN